MTAEEWTAVRLSLLIATTATLCSLPFGIAIAWLLAQMSDLLLDNFGAPDWVIKVFLLALLIGFPLALFFAWAYELTPEGVKKERDVDRSQSTTRQTGRKLDFLAQEFNRESNTICSKSNAVAVTAAGIELKVVIDQFREQVQNLE